MEKIHLRNWESNKNGLIRCGWKLEKKHRKVVCKIMLQVRAEKFRKEKINIG